MNVRINGLNNICIPGLPSSQRTRERASSAETTGELNQRLSGVNLGEFGLRAGFFRFFLDFFLQKYLFLKFSLALFTLAFFVEAGCSVTVGSQQHEAGLW